MASNQTDDDDLFDKLGLGFLSCVKIWVFWEEVEEDGRGGRRWRKDDDVINF